MMKTFFLSIITLFILTTATAQVEIQPGIKGGINLSDISNVNNGSRSNKITSFHIEALVSFQFSDFYALQPELGYSKQGAEIKTTVFGPYDDTYFEEENFMVELNYLSIPVMNKFFIGKSGLNIEVGPYIDILLSSKNIVDPSAIDLGIIGGIGYNLPKGISLNIRYKQGIVDVFGRNVDNGNGAETTEISELYLNKVIQFGVAYQFDF